LTPTLSLTTLPRDKRGEGYVVRQAEVQQQFLERFEALYPQMAFRAMRRLSGRAHGPYGLVLRAGIGRSGIEMDLVCAALTEGHPKVVARTIARCQQGGDEALPEGAVPVFIAPYFSEEACRLCREAGIGYLDLAGNAGLDTPHAYLYVGGRPNPNVGAPRIRKPFEGKAERVARALMLAPERRWPMRELAAAAQVSLGLASMITTELADSGMVEKSRAGLRLLDAGALLDAWSAQYDMRRSAFRHYRATVTRGILDRQLRRAIEGRSERHALTLWSGAQPLLGESLGGHLAFYWDGDPTPLAHALSLNAEQGQVHVFVFRPYDESVFWGINEENGGLATVHPLQLYLDLASGDERELELAQLVRARALRWTL